MMVTGGTKAAMAALKGTELASWFYHGGCIKTTVV